MLPHSFTAKSDSPRQIDRYIDFFGGTTPVLTDLAVAGCGRVRVCRTRCGPGSGAATVERNVELNPGVTSEEPEYK